MIHKTQILILKIEPRIDVLRSTSILKSLRKFYLQSEIYWVTTRRNGIILRDNPLIDDMLYIEKGGTIAFALNRIFDLLCCLDSDHSCANLANLLRAEKKLGLGVDWQGKDIIYNKGAEALRLYESSPSEYADQYSASYQAALFKALDIQGSDLGEMVFLLPPKSKLYAEEFIRENHLHPGKSPIILIYLGFNPRSAPVYYPPKSTSFVAEYLLEGLPAQVILSGGPREWGIYPNYFVQCPPGVIGAGCEQNFSVFCGLLYLADVVIGVDSLAIHLALALGKKVVILPGPTPATELEVYGRGVVLTTASPEKVYEEVKNILS